MEAVSQSGMATWVNDISTLVMRAALNSGWWPYNVHCPLEEKGDVTPVIVFSLCLSVQWLQVVICHR